MRTRKLGKQICPRTQLEGAACLLLFPETAKPACPSLCGEGSFLLRPPGKGLGLPEVEPDKPHKFLVWSQITP